MSFGEEGVRGGVGARGTAAVLTVVVCPALTLMVSEFRVPVYARHAFVRQAREIKMMVPVIPKLGPAPLSSTSSPYLCQLPSPQSQPTRKRCCNPILRMREPPGEFCGESSNETLSSPKWVSVQPGVEPQII